MPLIKPTVMQASMQNVAEGVVLRLFPELQNTHYVVFGILPLTEEKQLLLNKMREEYKKIFHAEVNLLMKDSGLAVDEVAACNKPCWILLPEEQANELTPNQFIQTRLSDFNLSYITLTWVEFDRDVQPSEFCLSEQRLTLECMGPVAFAEIERKMRDPGRYFTLRKYNEKDLFLIIQK